MGNGNEHVFRPSLRRVAFQAAGIPLVVLFIHQFVPGSAANVTIIAGLQTFLPLLTDRLRLKDGVLSGRFLLSRVSFPIAEVDLARTLDRPSFVDRLLGPRIRSIHGRHILIPAFLSPDDRATLHALLRAGAETRVEASAVELPEPWTGP